MEEDQLTASLEQAERLLLQGALQDAEAIYREILTARPGEPKASQGLGLIALHTGHASAAVELLQMASIGLPDNPAIHTHLGIAFGAAGDAGSAEACYLKAIDLAPSYADAHLNLANLLLEAGRIADAAPSYDKALELAPDSGPVHYGKAMLELRRGETSAAIEAFENAIARSPTLLPARVNLANLLLQSGRHEEAVDHLQEAVSFAPDSFDARLNLCAALQQTDRTAEAVEIARSAVALAPESPELLLNLSSAETSNGQPEEAWRTLDRALGVAPDYAPAKLNRAMVRLLLGDMPDGWSDYEARPSRGLIARPEFADLAVWRDEDIAGRTIIVWAEQGYGDVLQFARFLPRLIDLGARVVLDVPPALERLLRTFHDDVEISVRGTGDALPAADFHLPLLSLMHRLDIAAEDIPAPASYLSVPPDCPAPWQPAGGRAVGLCWQGSAANPNDHRRSIAPGELIERLSGCAGEFIGLQHGITDAPILNPGAEVADFAEMAALIDQLDLVISVDTSIAHLAGALGKPVWVLLPFAPDWRWQVERDDSPWYPTMRLFRQPQPGDWQRVIDDVAAALGG